MREIRENGTLTLIAFGYDDQGRRQSLTYENGVTTAYGYDGLGRLASHATNMHGVSGDQSLTFAYNPASQIVHNSRSNDLYSYVSLANAATAGTHNGLNQITQTGGQSVVHDARGNTVQIGTDLFTYSSENLMTSQTGAGSALLYDPLTRLARTAYNIRFAYDGTALVEEHKNASLIARYVHGPGTDEPLVWYDTGGTRRYLHADERGSIVAISADGGTTFPGGLIWQMNEYDEYGRPTSNNFGRFGYTGQVWLPEHNLWYYKGRMYDPLRGRFPQTDPIGYGGGINLYAYVGNNPINAVDPTGECLTENGVSVGICAEKEEVQTLLDARMADEDSEIYALEMRTRAAGGLIFVDFSSVAADGTTKVNMELVEQQTINDGRQAVFVTIDPRDSIRIYGQHIQTRQPMDEIATMSDIFEHAIAGHASDYLFNRGAIRNGQASEPRAIDAENRRRARGGSPFRRNSERGTFVRRVD